jgi:hypothetical protein
MNCLFCEQPLQLIQGLVLTCSHCPCDVEYEIGFARGLHQHTQQINWMCTHNGTMYQITIRPSDDPKHTTHSCIIRKVVGDGSKRPIILRLNCIPLITPRSTTEEFNYLLELTNEHPQLGVQMPCHFCNSPLPISAGNLEHTLFQRGGGPHGTCHNCQAGIAVHHAFKQIDGKYELSQVWWDIKIHDRYFTVQLMLKDSRFLLRASVPDLMYDEDILDWKYIPNITPTNSYDKVQTYLVYS